VVVLYNSKSGLISVWVYLVVIRGVESNSMTSTHKETKTQNPDQKTNTESTEKEETENVCSECGGGLIEDESQGELVCSDCGLVVDRQVIDRGPEWRAFDSKERDEKSRVGAPTTKTMHDKGLSTNIGWQNKDAYGNSLSASQRNKMSRLRKWDKRFKTQDSKERNLKHALGEIQRMASALGLSNQVQETAGVLYRQCLDKDLLPGRSIEGVSTACLYAAARQCNTPRTLDEFYPVSRAGDNAGNDSNTSIDRAYRYIMRELNLEIKPVDPRQYLNRILNDLSVEEKEAVRARAEELISAAERKNLHSGKSPTSLASGAIYAASLLENQHVTQREVADAANCTEVTIRNRYQEMIDAYQETTL
jgi:transcription initiation factor TFIIB